MGELAAWNKDAFEKRTKDLTALFIQVWKRPDDELTEEEQYGLTDIFSIEKLQTSEVLDVMHCEWSGRILEFNDFTDLYVKIIKDAFCNYPDVFDTKMKGLLKIVSNFDSVKQHVKKALGYKEWDKGEYLITHSNSSDKITRLQKLVKALRDAGNDVSLKLSYRITRTADGKKRRTESNILFAE